MNLNRPIVLYYHAGSGNHGCEAIANSTLKLIHRKRIEQGCIMDKTPIPIVISNNVDEDRKYSLGDLEKQGLCILVNERHIDKDFFAHVIYYGWRKVTGDKQSFMRYRFRDGYRAYTLEHNRCDHKKTDEKKDMSTASGNTPLAISIGGDNYCYPEMVSDLILAHDYFRKKGFDTVLWGCSIEPDSLKDAALLKDLMNFDRIYARESISYNALLEAGISVDKLELRKDPAFELETNAVSGIRDGAFELPGKYIGINLSPMVIAKESTSGITMENYKRFIHYILENTDQSVVLIPHVVWAGSDDRKPLSELYDAFKDSGRVLLIEDMPASDLKGYISQCSFFVGARTHSTIAAYSSGVPTLVIGYSVKSRGIATDLFGSYENYCLPVQELSDPDALINGYKWVMSHS
ncbi:Polysaccharide pyruvyl transferase family protein WcaK [Butyrivibrio proteoclasticus]|uniref:Polysaccharide pyruvyl transferase family protein WcaK n=1 Tax=Butyrivibrio proteoclasticus TaxID=43305 RepID=A0A1I5PNL0_9FIRM|nr:polysaccharide pyruvyl transferase family protein [Butyrivibrio proteoclasticus]SFP35101.1 Polysaccharide pyruvyl transferase family protein WcaK [Butyrivibrio proteoclasticus]